MLVLNIFDIESRLEMEYVHAKDAIRETWEEQNYRASNVRNHIKEENLTKWHQQNEKETWNEKKNNKNNIEKESWTKWH